MSLRPLELNKFHLLSSADDLKLSIASITYFRLHSISLRSLTDDAFVKALISGNIWVCRGKSCRFDIQISFNGNLLHGKIRSRALESLGSCIRDARLWSQLSVSASLEICQLEYPEQQQPGVSIYIHPQTTSSSPSPANGVPFKTIDVKAPESVLCVEFERLQIHLNFHTLTESRPSKRTKTVSEEPKSTVMMLLDSSLSADANMHLEDFEEVVGPFFLGCSKSITACISNPQVEGIVANLHLVVQEPILSVSTGHPENLGLDPLNQSTFQSRNKGTRKLGPKRYPTAATDTLKAWFERNSNNPYPTKEEKQQLMQQTSLKKNQVENWFRKARRSKSVIKPENDEMLSSKTNEKADMDHSMEDSGDEEMLLSQLSQSTITTPSRNSQSSITSTMSARSSKSSLKRTPPFNPNKVRPEPAGLPISAANKLASVATRLLITGCNTQIKRHMAGVTVEQPSPEPEKSLSRIVPSIFSPGFKELMSTNARFLPTISHAMSSSWVRNVQSPSLRKKLEALANRSTSPYTDETHAQAGEQGSCVRLASAIQARLWGMMQRKLYDPAAAKKLRHQTLSEGDYVVTDDEEDLLEGDILEENEIDFEDLLGGQFEGFDDTKFMEVDKFEDLLAGQDGASDNDFLGSLEDSEIRRERLQVEMETDEMLFGHGYEAESEDEILLLDTESESMLL